MITKRLVSTKLVGISLCLTVLFSGSMMLASQPAHAASTADNIISTGERYMGVPYRFGGSSGTDAFDCSGFTRYVFNQNGISLPHSSRLQSQAGTFVPRDQLQPGDLVFFYSPIHHVAIYMGDGKILHTYGSPGVTITDLNSRWWSSHYSTARRVLPSNGQAVSAPVSVPIPVKTPIHAPQPVMEPDNWIQPQPQHGPKNHNEHNKKERDQEHDQEHEHDQEQD
jgi:lipoprotein Spr